MNQNVSNDPLDHLLHQWADDRTASSEHIDRLQERIVSAIAVDDFPSAESITNGSSARTIRTTMFHPDPEQTLHSQPVSTRRASVTGFLVGVTLTSLVAFIWTAQITKQEFQNPGLASNDQSAIPEYARLNEDQLSSRAILLAEMKDLFGDRLNWLAETDSRINVGLSERHYSEKSTRLTGDAAQLVVRLVVEKRTSRNSNWQSAWSVDVMSQSEEVIELDPEDGNGMALTLWAYALPDGMVAVDSELSLAETDPSTSFDASLKRVTFSHIQQDGLPTEELLTGSDGVEYRVFQTVAVLDRKVG